MLKSFQEYTNESSLSRIYRHWLEHDSGTISAFRYAKDCGEGEVYELSENKKRNALLKASLLKLGFGVTAIKGVYIENFKSDKEREVNEESFIVVDIEDKGTLKKKLMELGEEYEQDSITFSEKGGTYYLIGTNRCPAGYPGYKKSVQLGKPMFGEKGEFHSKIGGRPFVFKQAIGESLETMLDHTPTEIRSIKELG